MPSMVGNFPYVLPADTRAAYPATSQQLATAIDTATKRYSASLIRNTSTALTDGTLYTVAFETLVSPYGGARYAALTTAAAGVTLPIVGLWHFALSAQFSIPGGTTAGRITAVLTRAGTNIEQDLRAANPGNSNLLTMSTIAECTAVGQVFGMQVSGNGFIPTLVKAKLYVAGPY